MVSCSHSAAAAPEAAQRRGSTDPAPPSGNVFRLRAHSLRHRQHPGTPPHDRPISHHCAPADSVLPFDYFPAGEVPAILAISASCINQAVKAVAIARGYLEKVRAFAAQGVARASASTIQDSPSST